MKKIITIILFTLYIPLFQGCISNQPTKQINDLLINIPTSFKECDKGKDVFKNQFGYETSYGWKDSKGNDINILAIIGGYTDYGDFPMIIKNKEPLIVDGLKTDLIHTEVFQGIEKNNYVIYLHKGNDIYMIWSEKMTKNEFKDILKTIKIK